MQPPMLHTGEKPVDPLIVNVWPLEPGTSSSYSVYEDSGVSVEYQKGVFARTPIKATRRATRCAWRLGRWRAAIPAC
jgi:alpha-glucosidase (family GH31 glycosyl hydrolase)